MFVPVNNDGVHRGAGLAPRNDLNSPSNSLEPDKVLASHPYCKEATLPLQIFEKTARTRLVENVHTSKDVLQAIEWIDKSP
jgi:hypothetical protein